MTPLSNWNEAPIGLIVRKETLTSTLKLFEIRAPQIARKRKPGQFIILRVHDRGERIPLTIADADAAAGTITFIVQEVGRTTRELGAKEVGYLLPDVVGPLGSPTQIEQFGRVVCVAGGVGVAEIYPVASALKAAGNEVISIIGARTRELIILEEQMREASHQLIVTTDDGSYGVQGLVTKPLQEMLERGETIHRVFCIGPVVMMRAVSELTRPQAVPTFVSLNPVMVDGTGMCGGCRVTVGGKVKFACVDGPDFDGHQVDYDELMARQAMYRDLERLSLERYEEQLTQRADHPPQACRLAASRA